MINWLENLKSAVSELEVEVNKFYDKGNNSAGTRSRKLLQDIKKLSQDGRNEIQGKKLAAKETK